MSNEDPLSGRIDALEAHAMQQERVIEDLHTALTAQWKIVDSLARQVAALDERMQEIGKPAGDPVVDGPPPHYEVGNLPSKV